MEQKKERRKLALAILISLFLHVAVGFSLAAFGSVSAPVPPPDETPSELTLVDLAEAPPPPLVPKNPPFLQTEASRESAEKPKEQTFESNANSLAASKKPATGDIPLPTQDGKDRPTVNLDTHDFSLPTEGSQQQPPAPQTPAPEVKPASSPKPSASEPPKTSPTVAPSPTEQPEQFAMLTATPPPPIEAPDETEPSPSPEIAPSVVPPAPRPKPQNPASNFQAQTQETRINGSITSRGPSSVNAVGTPIGRYHKAISDAIGSRWYYYINSKMDLISIGTAHIHAEVDAQGKLQNLRVVSNNANEAFANICLQSFQEAHLPPIPPDLVTTLPNGRMQVDITFTNFSN